MSWYYKVAAAPPEKNLYFFSSSSDLMAKMHFAKEAAVAQNFFFVCTTEDITLGVIALSSISFYRSVSPSGESTQKWTLLVKWRRQHKRSCLWSKSSRNAFHLFSPGHWLPSKSYEIVEKQEKNSLMIGHLFFLEERRIWAEHKVEKCIGDKALQPSRECWNGLQKQFHMFSKG